ncbi:MAG: hypothetical protein WCZ99_00440 [Candidatus Paceibacterota bacterium]
MRNVLLVLLVLFFSPTLGLGEDLMAQVRSLTLDLDSLLDKEGRVRFITHRLSTEGIVVSGSVDPETTRRYLNENIKYVRIQYPNKKIFIIVPPLPFVSQRAKEAVPTLDDLEVRLRPGRPLKDEYEKTARFLRQRMAEENPDKTSQYAKDWLSEMEKYLGLESSNLSSFDRWYRLIWAATFIEGEGIKLVFQ